MEVLTIPQLFTNHIHSSILKLTQERETHRLWHCEFALPNVLKQLEDGVTLKGVLPRCEVVQGHPTENGF